MRRNPAGTHSRSALIFICFSFRLYQTPICGETGTAGFIIHLSYQSISQWTLTVPTIETLDGQFPWLLKPTHCWYCECCSALITSTVAFCNSFSSSKYDLHKDALITVINASICDPLNYTFTSHALYSSKKKLINPTQGTF